MNKKQAISCISLVIVGACLIAIAKYFHVYYPGVAYVLGALQCGLTLHFLNKYER
jgi:hypothetical protein